MHLPPLTLNRAFMQEFTEAEAPCCGLGLVKSGDTTTGFIAMKPQEAIPPEVLGLGMAFGHGLHKAGVHRPVVRFAFHFYGHAQYTVLINPTAPLALQAIETMASQRDYFFFLLNPEGQVFAFRSEIDAKNLAGIEDSLPLMRTAQTSDSDYDIVVDVVRNAPTPSDFHYMNWVCRDDPSFTDLEHNVIALDPVV